MPRQLKQLTAALVVVALVAAFGFGTALAGSTLTGTLRGRVMDEKSQPIPGATVILKSDAMLRDQATITDAEGNYFRAGLQPGKYTVLVQMEGYTTISITTDVAIDKTTIANVTLRSGEITETVTVSAARPVVSKTSTEKSTTIEKKFTDVLPVARQYQSIIQFAPGVTGGSNPNILGGTQNSNVYLVDGVSARDPVTGTFGSNFTFDAIEAVDIKLTGVSAEYGQFQGGLTNLITKSGGNSFTGSARDVITSARWTKLVDRATAARYMATVPGASSFTYPSTAGKINHNVGVTFGGPILTDTAWFFGAYNRALTLAFNTLGWSRGGDNADGRFPRLFDGDFSLVKTTWQVTNNHRLQFQYTEDPAKVPVCYVGTCMDSSALTLQGQGGKFWIVNWNGVWGANIVTDFKYAEFQNGFTQEFFRNVSTFPGQPVNYFTGSVTSAYTSDFAQHWDAPYFGFDPERRNRTQLEGSTTIFLDTKKLGTHTVKIGADYQKQSRITKDRVFGDGYFVFDWVVGQDPRINPNANPYTVNNRVYSLFYAYDPAIETGPRNKITTFYVQDDWQLNQRLALNLGVRYEKSQNENNVGEKIIDQTTFAPRLGAAWDITGSGKHVAKATYAQYIQGVNLTTVNQFSRASGGRSSYTIYSNQNVDANGFPLPGVPDFLSDPAPIRIESGAGANNYAPGLKAQSINEFTVGYEWALSPTFGVGVRYVDREWDNMTTQRYAYANGVTRTQTLINNPNAKRSYKGFIFTAEKRFSNNWQLLGSYTNSDSEGNVTNEEGFDTFGAYVGVPLSGTDPNLFGFLPWHVKHNVKMQGVYRIPLKSQRHSLSVGGNFNYATGGVYTPAQNAVRIVVACGANQICETPIGSQRPTSQSDPAQTFTKFLEKRGNRNFYDFWTADTSINYSFQFNKKVTAEARFEVYNVLNRTVPLTENTTFIADNVLAGVTTGSQAATNAVFEKAATIGAFQAPRRYQFQVALTW